MDRREADGPATPEGAVEQSLYDRMGGIFAISAVVDRFSDAIITNPKLNQNPALKAWNETEAANCLPEENLGPLTFTATATGIPGQYAGTIQVPLAGDWEVMVMTRIFRFSQPMTTVTVPFPHTGE